MTGEVFCAVLAAGRASRFGSLKQLAELNGEALVAQATRLADKACPGYSLLVAGHEAATVIAASGGHCRFSTVNARYTDGLGTSIAHAAQAVRHTASGLLIVLADQPRLTVEHLQALLRAFDANPDRAVASRYASTIGTPAIFPASALERLSSLDGDRGAKHLLASMTPVEIVFEDAAADVDRPEDLGRRQ